MNRRSVIFLVATFSVTWIFHGTLAVLTQTGVLELPGFLGMSLLIIGGSAPTIIAFIMVHMAKDTMVKKRFYQSLLTFKVGYINILYALLVPVLLGVLAVMIRRSIDTPWVFAELQPLYLIPLFLLNGIVFGGLEEIGWRGILQENMMRQRALPVALVIGLIWGVWHVPMFFVTGLSQETYAVIPYLLQAIVFSCFLTGLYLKTRSLFLTILFHASINAMAMAGFSIAFAHTAATYVTLAITMTIGALSLITIEKQYRSPRA